MNKLGIACTVVLAALVYILVGSIGWFIMFTHIFPIEDFGLRKAILAAIASLLIIAPLTIKITKRD